MIQIYIANNIEIGEYLNIFSSSKTNKKPRKNTMKNDYELILNEITRIYNS